MIPQTQPSIALSPYQILQNEYLTSGITYKSNEVLSKTAQMKGYPYPILLHVAKLFHMNQFQVVFLAHILNDQECPYTADPAIYETDMELKDLRDIYQRMSGGNGGEIKAVKKGGKQPQQNQNQDENQNENQDEISEEQQQIWTLSELRKLFIYLLVIGYSVKYYLNESTKAYQDQMKRKYPQFFTTIFNIWVDKYSSKMLRTNPRKINQFYTQLFVQETGVVENGDIDCQYRNYNEIVQELIKATTDVEEVVVEEDRESQNNL